MKYLDICVMISVIFIYSIVIYSVDIYYSMNYGGQWYFIKIFLYSHSIKYIKMITF